MSRPNSLVLVDLCSLGDMESVQRLLGQGVDVNSKDDNGDTGLIAALDTEICGDCDCSDSMQQKIAKFLLAQPGIDINRANNDGNTALHVCGIHGNMEGLRRILLGHPGRNINAKNSLGLTPLRMAVSSGNIDFVKELLKTNEVSLEDRDAFGDCLESEALITDSRTEETLTIQERKGLRVHKQLLGANKENIPSKALLGILSRAIVVDRRPGEAENARKRGKKGKNKKPVAKDSATNSEECLPRSNGGSAIMVGPEGISKPQKQVAEAGGEISQMEDKVSWVQRRMRWMQEIEKNKKICWYCHAPKETTKLFKCQGCHKARYCGERCQRDDWERHEGCCAILMERSKGWIKCA